MKNTFYSNGKLLLTGEYVVLDGALSLAIPTEFGQSLIVESIDEPKLIWKSLNYNDDAWFEHTFLLQNNKILNQIQDDNDISKRLLQILKTAKTLNPEFLNSKVGYTVTTKLDFPQFWGLGSSSTLINNIANWANVDAYKLLELTFGGSGYDIACAQHNTAITYQLPSKNSEILHCVQNNKKRIVNEVSFNPNFKDHLYFVYLNKKQNSREGINQYHSTKKVTNTIISEINDITLQLLLCNSLNSFNDLIVTHEQIIGSMIKEKPIKELLFNDYKGTIKSLGAWGGDFILVTSLYNPDAYFKAKGFSTIIPYKDMVLNTKSSN